MSDSEDFFEQLLNISEYYINYVLDFDLSLKYYSHKNIKFIDIIKGSSYYSEHVDFLTSINNHSDSDSEQYNSYYNRVYYDILAIPHPNGFRNMIDFHDVLTKTLNGVNYNIRPCIKYNPNDYSFLDVKLYLYDTSNNRLYYTILIDIENNTTEIKHYDSNNLYNNENGISLVKYTPYYENKLDNMFFGETNVTNHNIKEWIINNNISIDYYGNILNKNDLDTYKLRFK